MDLTLEQPGDHLFIRSVSARGIQVVDDFYNSSIIVSTRQVVPDWPVDSVENITEQQIIERIIDMKDSDLSLRAICRQLQSEGIKCRSNVNWHHTTIKKIIERIALCNLSI